MKDKVVIVTGAIKGMGFGTAKTLLKKDAKVVLVYRSDDARALQVKDELKSYSPNMILLKADIIVDGGYSCVWPGRDKNKL